MEEGGHDIPKEVIERRYHKGIKNLFEIYLPIVDKCFIFDNSEGEQMLIAEKEKGHEVFITNIEKYNSLKTYAI